LAPSGLTPLGVAFSSQPISCRAKTSNIVAWRELADGSRIAALWSEAVHLVAGRTNRAPAAIPVEPMVADSSLGEEGFEPSVPRKIDDAFAVRFRRCNPVEQFADAHDARVMP
jgi:hypothetical protein